MFAAFVEYELPQPVFSGVEERRAGLLDDQKSPWPQV